MPDPALPGLPALPQRVAVALEAYAARYGLSPRERRVLVYVAAEYSLAKIATLEGVSPNTVKGHARGILRRTGAERVETAVLRAIVGALAKHTDAASAAQETGP